MTDQGGSSDANADPAPALAASGASVWPGGEEPGAAPRVWLTPGVRGIGTASFLADVGHEVPTALMASFVTSTLGAPAVALGLIEGVSDALAGTGPLRRRCPGR